MPRDHSIKMRQAGLDTGLDRSVPRLSAMRVHPDHRVRDQPEPAHLFSQQPGIVTLPAIARDHHDGAARQPAPAPAVQECADHLAQPSASGPVRYEPAGCSQRLVCLPHSQGWADPGEAGAHGEHLDLIGCRANDAVRQPQQRVGVELHRAGYVDQHHNPSAPHPRPPAAELGELARRTQLGTERTSQVDRAATMRSASQRAAQRRNDVESVEERCQLGSLLVGEGCNVAVTQHFGRARAGREALVGKLIPRIRPRGRPSTQCCLRHSARWFAAFCARHLG